MEGAGADAAAACESERKGEEERAESFLDSIALKSSLGGDLFC